MSETTDTADDLRDLDDATRKASDALREGTREAKALEEKLKQLGEVSIRAGFGGEVAEKFQHVSKAFRLAGDSSLTMGQRSVAGAAGLKMLGGTVLGAARDLGEFVQSIAKANADLFEYDRRARALGAAHLAMQQATAGATETTAAFSLAQGLAARGIEQSTSTMTVLGRAMREHANARATSQQEASQTIQSALDGDAAAAARLGVRITGLTSDSQRHAAIVQQLAAQQRGVAVETRNAAEEARVQGETLERAADGWKAVVSHAPGWSALQAVVGGVSGALASWRGADAATEAQARRTTGSLHEETAAVRAQQMVRDRAAADTTRSLREQRAALQAQLVDARDSSGVTRQLAEAQAQYTAALQRTRDVGQTAGLRGNDLEQQRIRLLQDEIGKRDQLNRLRQQADQSRSAERDLGHLAAQARSRGMIVGLEVQSIPLRQRLNELLAEAANLARREGETQQDFVARAQQTLQMAQAAREEATQRARAAQEERMARNELRASRADAEALGTRQVQLARLIGETRTDWARRELTAQQGLNTVERERDERAKASAADFRRESLARVTEARKALDEQRAAAQVASRDRALIKAAERRQEEEDFRQRSSLDVQMREQFGLSAAQLQTDAERSAGHIKMLSGSVSELGAGAAQALLAAANSGEDAGAALAKYVDEWAGAKAIQWGMQALEALAGAGVAYFYRPDAVPGLLASAATFAGLAAGAGIATAAIPNAPSGGGGAGGGGAGGERMASARGPSAAGGSSGPAQITVNINSLTAAGPETAAAVSRAINQGVRYGVPPQAPRPVPRSV